MQPQESRQAITPLLQCLDAKWLCLWCHSPHACKGNVVLQLLHGNDSLQQGTDWCAVLPWGCLGRSHQQVRLSMTARGLMVVGVWVNYSMPACRVLGCHKQHHLVLHWARWPSLEAQLVALCRGPFSHVHGCLQEAAGLQPSLGSPSSMLVEQPQIEPALLAGTAAWPAA